MLKSQDKSQRTKNSMVYLLDLFLRWGLAKYTDQVQTCNSSAPVSQSAGIPGICHHAWLLLLISLIK